MHGYQLYYKYSNDKYTYLNNNLIYPNHFLLILSLTSSETEKDLTQKYLIMLLLQGSHFSFQNKN